MNVLQGLLFFAQQLGYPSLLFDSIDDGECFIEMAKKQHAFRNINLVIEWVGPPIHRQIEGSIDRSRNDPYRRLSAYRVGKDGIVYSKK